MRLTNDGQLENVGLHRFRSAQCVIKHPDFGLVSAPDIRGNPTELQACPPLGFRRKHRSDSNECFYRDKIIVTTAT
jgi:hypothetical protein